MAVRLQNRACKSFLRGLVQYSFRSPLRSRFASSWARELKEHERPPQQVLPEIEDLPTRPWAELGVNSRVAHALVCAGFAEPTEIQRSSLGVLQQSPKATLIAAETGAGKTNAYLVPILSEISDNNSLRPIRRPLVVILAPTRELVAQVHDAAMRVFRGILRVSSHTGGPLRKKQQRTLSRAPVDVLVTTPSALSRLRRNRAIFLSNVRHAIFDEADVLLRNNGGFDEDVNAIVTSLRATGDRENRNIGHTYVAASVPQSLREALAERHGSDVSVAQTVGLHRGPDSQRVKSVFVRTGGGEEGKFKSVVKIVEDELRDKNARLMVFCDNHGRRERLVDLLRSHLGISVAHMSGGRELAVDERMDAWDSFKDRRGEEPSDEHDTRIAVCAQSYGRGIDHTGVTCVVMVDVPMTGTEYMHRAGRIRGRGTVYTMVSRRERSMGAALYLSTAQGHRLAGLTAQKARVQYPKGLPVPLLGEAASAVAQAKKRRKLEWREPQVNLTLKRRLKRRGR